jgi:hypothetical protein
MNRNRLRAAPQDLLSGGLWPLHFTRLTNAFSKKVENHAAMVALYFMYYNFARVHQTLRVTPGMEAGISDHIGGVEEIVGLLD